MRPSSVGLEELGPSLRLPYEVTEDGFDYALVLRRDEQYRQIAQHYYKLKSPSASSDADAASDIENQRLSGAHVIPGDVLSGEEDDNEEAVGSSYLDFVMSADGEGTGDDDADDTEANENAKESHIRAGVAKRPSSAMDRGGSVVPVVSVEEYTVAIKHLQQRQRRVSTAARRSSAAFLGKFATSDKEALNKLLYAISAGVHVKRHQAGFSAETVRLFSLNVGKTIQWAPEVQRPYRALSKYSSIRERQQLLKSKARDNGLDCCIAICGCGDDLLAENDKLKKAIPTSSDKNRRGWFTGFQVKGAFEDGDIVSIHKATAEDPTCRGSFGTDSLRRSKDPYNSALTFSVVYRVRYLGQVIGHETFDMECESEDQYFLLLRGFSLLRKEPAVQEDASTFDTTAFAGDALRRVEALWTTGREIIIAQRAANIRDPVAKLFEPSILVDPWRMVGLKMNRKDGLARSPPEERFLGWTSAGTQIWARLHMAGMEVKCIYSWDLSRILLKVRCPPWRLEEMAEKMHMKLKRRDGSIRRFRISHRDEFAETTNGTLFSSGERQQIIDRIIRSRIRDGGAELGENTALGKHIEQSYPLHVEGPLDALRHSWITFWKADPSDEIAKPWSAWATPWKETISRSIAVVSVAWSRLLYQPIDGIRDYYGENVGFLFAYTAFYTRWLITPSILGFIVFCIQVYNRKLDNVACLPFGVFIMIWASFMLAYWRQKQSALAYRWGVLDYEMDETERPQFVGKDRYDEETAEMRKVFPTWKRALRYLITVPVLIAVIVLILVIMFTIFSTQDRILKEYVNGSRSFNLSPFLGSGALDATTSASSAAFTNSTSVAATEMPITFSLAVASDPTFWVIALFYPTLYGLIITVSTLLVDNLAVVLNNFENHRTQSAYVNRLILKVFSFRFISVFTSLYWYAFSPTQNAGNAYMRVAVVVFCMLTVASWGEAFLGVYVPTLYQRMMTFRMRHEVSSINKLVYRAKEHDDANDNSRKDVIEAREELLGHARSRVWQQANQVSYTTFADYAALVVQLGFVLLFSAIFPLAPLIALINNLVMLRMRAYKVCYTMQRPLSQKGSGIGVWEDILQIMTVVGVLTNLALFGVTSEVLRTYLGAIGPVGIAILLFVFEHAILLFKYWLQTSVPRVPVSILRLQEKEKMGNLQKKLDAHSSSKLGDHFGDGDDDGDLNAAVPLLAPLNELRDRSLFLSVDELDVDAETHKENMIPRQSVAKQSGAAPASPASTGSSPKKRVTFVKSSSQRLSRSSGRGGKYSPMSDNSSLDSSDSDEYELARNSRTAIEELRNSPKKASISSSESIARESIASRLRNFQNKRRAQVVDAEDPQAATDSHGGVDEDKSDAYIIFESIAAAAHVSRKSILNMFGWRTSGVSEDGVGQVEETCVKGSGDVESKATVVEQTTETVTVKDVEKGNQKAVIPVSAPITKTPIGATKSNVVRTPTQNIPVDRKSTNKGAKAPSEMKASSSPVSNAKKPQVVARKVLVPSPDNREAIRRRIDSAKADKLPMHIVSSNIIKQTKASNPFSFADQNLAPI